MTLFGLFWAVKSEILDLIFNISFPLFIMIKRRIFHFKVKKVVKIWLFFVKFDVFGRNLDFLKITSISKDMEKVICKSCQT